MTVPSGRIRVGNWPQGLVARKLSGRAVPALESEFDEFERHVRQDKRRLHDEAAGARTVVEGVAHGSRPHRASMATQLA